MAEESQNTKLVLKLCLVVVGMFAFGFLMVPIYNVFCEVTGLNGKTPDQVVQEKQIVVDESREVRVTFIANNNENMPWDFRPQQASITVHPGEVVSFNYFAKNTTAHDMVSQSVPSVVPSSAAQYFRKIECFCFNNQPLKAGESAELGLQFYVDAELPKSIKDITLAYTIFDITKAKGEADQKKHES